MARDGALVYVNFRGNSEAGQSVVDEIESASGEALAIQTDMGASSQ